MHNKGETPEGVYNLAHIAYILVWYMLEHQKHERRTFYSHHRAVQPGFH